MPPTVAASRAGQMVNSRPELTTRTIFKKIAPRGEITSTAVEVAPESCDGSGSAVAAKPGNAIQVSEPSVPKEPQRTTFFQSAADKKRERAVGAIIHASADDAESLIAGIDDIDVLRRARKRAALWNRKSRLRLIERRLLQLEKNAPDRASHRIDHGGSSRVVSVQHKDRSGRGGRGSKQIQRLVATHQGEADRASHRTTGRDGGGVGRSDCSGGSRTAAPSQRPPAAVDPESLIGASRKLIGEWLKKSEISSSVAGQLHGFITILDKGRRLVRARRATRGAAASLYELTMRATWWLICESEKGNIGRSAFRVINDLIETVKDEPVREHMRELRQVKRRGATPSPFQDTERSKRSASRSSLPRAGECICQGCSVASTRRLPVKTKLSRGADKSGLSARPDTAQECGLSLQLQELLGGCLKHGSGIRLSREAIESALEAPRPSPGHKAFAESPERAQQVHPSSTHHRRKYRAVKAVGK